MSQIWRHRLKSRVGNFHHGKCPSDDTVENASWWNQPCNVHAAQIRYKNNTCWTSQCVNVLQGLHEVNRLRSHPNPSKTGEALDHWRLWVAWCMWGHPGQWVQRPWMCWCLLHFSLASNSHSLSEEPHSWIQLSSWHPPLSVLQTFHAEYVQNEAHNFSPYAALVYWLFWTKGV